MGWIVLIVVWTAVALGVGIVVGRMFEIISVLRADEEGDE